jgi:hypothetical protein
MFEAPTSEAIGQRSKTCPRCAEDIEALASWCPWCGAHFVVTSRGYCHTCHDVTASDTAGRCKACGSSLVDVRIESALVAEPAPAPVVTPPAAEPPGPTPAVAVTPAPVAAQPPPPVPTTTAGGVAVGRARAGVALAPMQWAAYLLQGLAAVGLFLLFVFQFENESLVLAVGEGAFVKEVAYIGWGAPIAALLVSILIPQPVGPRGMRFRFSRGRSERMKHFKGERRRHGSMQIVSARWFTGRLVAVALVWLAGIPITFASLSTVENAALQPGAYIATAFMLLGALTAVTLLVTRKRAVLVDDEGNVFESDAP